MHIGTIQHFLLTRFNLLIWNKDKERHKVRSTAWLEHRFSLFEQYCLPSIKNQTCKGFAWIVLFDSTTPERYKERIAKYQRDCPQLNPVYVEPERGRYFAEIFKQEVRKLLDYNHNENDNENPSRVLTTYLDNDDALNVRFVEDIQLRAAALSDGTFINYNDGYQFYTDYHYLMHITHRRNHFMSVVESIYPKKLKTIYGYGSHYYIEKIEGVKIEYVKNIPMWCEVVHEMNMDNDAYFLRAKMVKDTNILVKDYGLHKEVRYGFGLYLFRFLPRYMKTFVRRIKYYFFGRHW